MTTTTYWTISLLTRGRKGERADEGLGGTREERRGNRSGVRRYEGGKEREQMRG